MRSVLVLLSAVLLIAFAEAQWKSNMTKPIVNLEKRPRPVWNRPPEERRKLSIFPRNNMKFVVTPKIEVNNENAAKEGLSTKRPLIRKLIMQDRNEKGTWSFAPREPLMKTNRFTVTMAPPIFSARKAIDEMKSEESKKVKTIMSRLNTEKSLSKEYKLNKGNLIAMTQIKNTEPPVSKASDKVEKKFIEDKISLITNVSDTKDFDIIQMNDNNSTLKLNNVPKNYPIDIRRSNVEDVITSANDTENEHGSVKLNKTSGTSNNGISKDFLESRAVDLNELKYAIEQHESNSLTMDDEENNNFSTAQILSFNDLEMLLEKIENNTESAADFHEKIPSNSPKNETKAALEDITKFDITKPNEFYDVISLSNDNDEGNKTNVEEDKKIFRPVLHGSLIANEEKHIASETNVLNGEDFTEQLADSLIVGNLKSLINYTEKEATGIENHHQMGIAAKTEEMKTNTKYTLTEKPFINNPKNEVINKFTNGTEYENKTENPRELNSNDTDSFNSTEILLEMYESNMSLSSEELPDELVTEVPNESVTENVNFTIVEIPNEIFIESVSIDEISKESSHDTELEERSNESSIGISTGEEISNESSSNMSGEELSNESSSFIEEIPNEYIVESANNFTGEEIFNESSSNMAEEEISNESYPDKSNNLTEEGSSEYIIEASNNFTGEEISNESSSNMSAEEISNESDKSYLTEDISSESTTEISPSSTDEETEQSSIMENSDVIIDEWISDKSVGSSLEPEISEEALTNRFKRSNNIIEEENLPTTVSGFKYTGNEITLKHDITYKNIHA